MRVLLGAKVGCTVFGIGLLEERKIVTTLGGWRKICLMDILNGIGCQRLFSVTQRICIETNDGNFEQMTSALRAIDKAGVVYMYVPTHSVLMVK